MSWRTPAARSCRAWWCRWGLALAQGLSGSGPDSWRLRSGVTRRGGRFGSACCAADVLAAVKCWFWLCSHTVGRMPVVVVRCCRAADTTANRGSGAVTVVPIPACCCWCRGLPPTLLLPSPSSLHSRRLPCLLCQSSGATLGLPQRPAGDPGRACSGCCWPAVDTDASLLDCSLAGGLSQAGLLVSQPWSLVPLPAAAGSREGLLGCGEGGPWLRLAAPVAKNDKLPWLLAALVLS